MLCENLSGLAHARIDFPGQRREPLSNQRCAPICCEVTADIADARARRFRFGEHISQCHGGLRGWLRYSVRLCSLLGARRQRH